MFEILIILWQSNNCFYLTSFLPDNCVAKLPVVKFSFSEKKKCHMNMRSNSFSSKKCESWNQNIS